MIQRMFKKYWANRIRYYTSKVHLRGLIQNQEFLPTKVGFVCIAATFSRPVSNKLDFSKNLSNGETLTTDS